MSLILVTGATGFVGRYLVRELRRRNHKVLVFARSTSDTREAQELGCLIQRGDLINFDQVRSAVKMAKCLIHVGEIGMSVKDSGRLNVDLVRAMIEAAKETSGFRHIVQVSSVTVVSPPIKSPADEDTPPLAEIRDSYTIYKRECEKVLRDADVSATIIRGSAIYGPGANYLLWFAKWLRRMRLVGLPFPGKHSAELSFIHVADMAAALAAAAEQAKPSLEIYNAADDAGCSISKFAAMLATELDTHFKLMQIPIGAQRAFAYSLDGALGILGASPNVRGILDFLSYDGIFSNEKIKRELGLELSFPTLAKGLPDTAAWIKNNWK